MERFKQQYESFSHTIEGAIKLTGKRFIAGGDSRFGFPPFEIFKKNTIDDIEKWVITSLENDQLEVSIVGDFDVEAVVEQASQYLGSLPKRNSAISHKTSNPIKFPEGKLLKINVPTKIPKGMVDVSYPTEDFWDIKRTRRFMVLGHVFSEMMRLRIREELGATYSAYAYNSASRGFPGYGVLHAAAQVDPEDADQVVSEIKRISENLSRNGVGKEQHKLALDPVLTRIKDMIRTNDYWLNSVLTGSKEHPEQLDWSRTIMPDFSSITAQELSSLAKQYLDNDKAALIIIKPEE
jgi:zinc protease